MALQNVAFTDIFDTNRIRVNQIVVLLNNLTDGAQNLTAIANIYTNVAWVGGVNIGPQTNYINTAWNTANAAFNKANAANVFAFSSSANAALAFGQANVAYNLGNTVLVIANDAFDTANAAFNKANTSSNTTNIYSQANLALTIANLAFNKANSDVGAVTANGGAASISTPTLNIANSGNIFAQTIGTGNLTFDLIPTGVSQGNANWLKVSADGRVRSSWIQPGVIQYTLLFPAPINSPLLISSPRSGAILSANIVTDTANCNVQISINTTVVGGLNNMNANATIKTVTCTGSNTLSVGDSIWANVQSVTGVPNYLSVMLTVLPS